MSKSYAEIATEWQGTGNFPGHDIYQNGIINKDCNRLYIAGWHRLPWKYHSDDFPYVRP